MRSCAMLAVVLSVLGTTERAHAQTPLAERATLSVPALTLGETTIPDVPPKHVSALDASMHEDIVAPSGPLFCHGPGCSMTIAIVSKGRLTADQQKLASTRFISSIGAGASALLAYFCTPKVGQVTWRFGLVSAVGGPAFGLRVRW